MGNVLRLAFVAGAMVLNAAAVPATPSSGANVSPIFAVRLPPDYRNWQAISVAHEAGSLNDIRIVLGNALAIKAYRKGQRPFPDGSVIARIAWKLEPSPRNDAIFGHTQSFVTGLATNVQIEVKDSAKYVNTGGWGYGQFENGKANQDAALMATCFECHRKLPASEDFIFTPYSL